MEVIEREGTTSKKQILCRQMGKDTNVVDLNQNYFEIYNFFIFQLKFNFVADVKSNGV